MNLLTIIKYSYKSTYNYESSGSQLLGIKRLDFFGTALLYPLIIMFLIYSDFAKASSEKVSLFFLIFPLILLVFNYFSIFYFQFPKTLSRSKFFFQFPISKASRKAIEFICLASSPSILILLSSALSFYVFDFRNLSLNIGHVLLILFLEYVLATLASLLFIKPTSKEKTISQFDWKSFGKERIVVTILLVLYFINHNTNTIDLEKILTDFQSSYQAYEVTLFALCFLTGVVFLNKR